MSSLNEVYFFWSVNETIKVIFVLEKRDTWIQMEYDWTFWFGKENR